MDITKDFLSKINSTKILVIAGSLNEFNSFVDLALYKNSQEGVYDGYEFFYYSKLDAIRGIMFDRFLFYGTGTRRSDIDMDKIRMSIKS